MKHGFIHIIGWIYRNICTKIFFRFDAEPIHEFVLNFGEIMGKIPGVHFLLRLMIRVSNPMLNTEVAGIRFENPIGLSAGFDHEAQLTQMISGFGFGFESVGTITNGAYGGNPYPRIKRLIKSRSLLVNKGFKSTGMDKVLAGLAGKKFSIPTGISIGRTNTDAHNNHADAIADMVDAFKKVEASKIPFSYLELNISCPNLTKDISFYIPERFRELLAAIFRLEISKPLFIKMPITLTDDETKKLLDVIKEFPVAAVIFGNLSKDKTHPGFNKDEIAKWGQYKGHWSGTPCKERSDELIRLAYIYTKGKLPIVGCGGTFSVEDAYKKIKLGASLIQMVTGLIFNGPQFPAEICADLPALLKRDGFKNIKEAVGADVKLQH